MAHDRDHDHHATPPAAPREPPPVDSRACPDRKRPEHPSVLPREPVDPRSHPTRRAGVPLHARPA